MNKKRGEGKRKYPSPCKVAFRTLLGRRDVGFFNLMMYSICAIFFNFIYLSEYLKPFVYVFLRKGCVFKEVPEQGLMNETVLFNVHSLTVLSN